MGAAAKNRALLARGLVYVSSRHRLYGKLPENSRVAERGKFWVRFYWPAEVLKAYEDLFPARIVQRKAGGPIDLLLAIYGANQAAKRFRDAAVRCYASGVHGLAGSSRERKEFLYALKDRGIVAAVKAGRLDCAGTHGDLTIYRGEGFCFHSLLRQVGACVSWTMAATSTADLNDELIFVESKPRTATEPRLVDCVCTLKTLPEVRVGLGTGWEKRSFPPRRVERYLDEDFDEPDWDEGL